MVIVEKIRTTTPTLIWVIISVSVGLYIISLMNTAISITDYNGRGSFSGLELLLHGGVGVILGGLLEWFIWLANPLYIMAIIKLFQKKHNALTFSGISSLLALSFLLWDEILVSGSGRNETITSFDIGYYLWTSSLITLTVGLLINKIKRRPTTE